jgi:MFS family permease
MKKSDIRIIYLAGFLFSLPLALTSYVNSSFLENYIDKNYVGMVYVVGSIITILSMLRMPKILTKYGNRNVVMFSGVVAFASLIYMAFGSGDIFILSSFILYFVSGNFIIASLDIFIEDLSDTHSIGKFRGLYLMIMSSAWVVAQFISGSVINKSSFLGIYLLSALFMVLFYILFIFFLKDFKDPEYKKMPVMKTVRFFIRNKNISRIYLLNFLLRFFFAWMIIYSPIYLHEYLGFTWDKIGIIFTIMLLPFVLLDFPLGKLSDKIGEKKMLFWGFIISATSTLFIPLILEPTLWLWAIVLFTTRVGAAVIEIMSEAYFFKSVTEENDDEISFFRNTGPLSFIVAPLCATALLFLLPSFKYLFFVLSAVMFFGAFVSIRLKDIK